MATKEQKKNLQYKILIQQTLLQGRRNRDTINAKLTFISAVAQRRFVNGLTVLGFLLMLDPISRFGLLESARNQLGFETAVSTTKPREDAVNAAKIEVSTSQLRMDRDLPEPVKVTSGAALERFTLCSD